MKPIQAFFFRDFSQSYIPQILEEIYIDKVYEYEIEVKRPKVVLDIGANIGLWSYYASQYCKKVYSVEPAAEHYKVLDKMVRYNALRNVTLIKKALSHENGTATFYHSTNTTMYSLKQEVANKKEKEEVETITIDKLLDDLKVDTVDFMKFDVEGSECQIIGSKSFDKVVGRIKTIIGEYHTWSGINPDQFRTSFLDRGYSFKQIPDVNASLFIAKYEK